MHRSLSLEHRMEETGLRSIRSDMPHQHRAFFAQLPLILVGSLDDDGRPWASALTGSPGFVVSPDPTRLQIEAFALPGDPLALALRPGAAIGLLGIELQTRRRNRANGYVTSVTPSGFEVLVEQSYGNCPKYIVRRDLLPGLVRSPVEAEPFEVLDDEALALIRTASTFFVATSAHGHPDVSHRGGQPGFVEVDKNGVLLVPDYTGNFFFNTIGNLLVEPHAGVLFIDFVSGDLLQFTGDTELVLDGPEIARRPGAQRLWRLQPTRGAWLRSAFRLCFGEGTTSTVSPSLLVDA